MHISFRLLGFDDWKLVNISRHILLWTQGVQKQVDTLYNICSVVDTVIWLITMLFSDRGYCFSIVKISAFLLVMAGVVGGGGGELTVL